MVERFFPKEIISDVKGLKGIKIENFIPDEEGRDRFGNRLFVSQNLAYLDGTLNKTKAGILISPEGEEFVKKHPGTILEIDRGLSSLETSDGNSSIGKIIYLKDGVTLESIKTGGQSNFYVLTIGKEKYAIKTHAPIREGYPLIHQPYVNEMLQSQSLATDLKSQLDDLRIKMSTFLFASGQVSCTSYEESTLNFNDTKGRIQCLSFLVSEYVLDKKYEGHSLWTNVNIDLRSLDTQRGTLTIENNFRVKPDGTLVWIDPFIYSRPISQ